MKYNYVYIATTSRTPDLFASGLSMIILLPKKGQTLSETVFKLYGFTLPKLYRALHTAKLDYADDEVEVYLPKFEINSDLDVQTILKRVSGEEFFYNHEFLLMFIFLVGNNRNI